MNDTHDTAMWWPPAESDPDAAMTGAEDVLGDLSDPAADVDSLGTGG